ncbi:hypothetical protein [Lacinutrix cladophorae]
MKNLKNVVSVITLVFMILISFSSKAQESFKTNDKIPTSVKLVGKFHAVITYLETKEFYKNGMTKDEFVKSTTSCVDDKELINIFKPCMEEIYVFHTKKLSPDQVYDYIDGNSFAKTAIALKKYEIKYDREASRIKKPKWFNWLRKFIDWLDDTWV